MNITASKKSKTYGELLPSDIFRFRESLGDAVALKLKLGHIWLTPNPNGIVQTIQDFDSPVILVDHELIIK